MEPWYTSYYFVDLFHLGPIESSQCLQQNPSELAKRIKWLVALIIRKDQIGSIGSSDSHNNVFFSLRIAFEKDYDRIEWNFILSMWYESFYNIFVETLFEPQQ